MRAFQFVFAVIAFLMLFPLQAESTPGDTIRSFPTPACCSQGLAFDGDHLWVVDRMTDMVYKIDPDDGGILDSIPAPGYVPRGLAFDGDLLWCADADEEMLYGIDPATKIIERTLYSPVSSVGDLAWDGEYLWLTDYRADEIHRISTEDGTTINTIPAPSRTVEGLTFDGTYLWASDRINNSIYMITPDLGEVIIGFDSPGPYNWGLAWGGSTLWAVDYETDRIYELVVDDDTRFTRTHEKSEHVEFVHQVRNYGPDMMTDLDVYLAVPKDMNNQKLLSDVQFQPAPVDFVTDRWGQKVAHFNFKNVPGTESRSVKMIVDVELYANRYFIRPERVGKLSEIPSDISEKYLQDDTKFSVNDPVIQNAVTKAVGDETNPYWIARRIFRHVIDKIEYELAGGWNIAPTVLDRGTGSCSEYSFVYISMCRAAGLPARYVGSVVIRGDDACYDKVFHRWVEVYLPHYGWVPIDPSGGDHALPYQQARAFGYLSNRFLITTAGGGGSEYLGWSYNADERWKSKGKCKIVVENFGEWSPITDDE